MTTQLQDAPQAESGKNRQPPPRIAIAFSIEV
jgi:hypothetical protein